MSQTGLPAVLGGFQIETFDIHQKDDMKNSQPSVSIVIASYTIKRLTELLELITTLESQVCDLEIVFVVERDKLLVKSLLPRLRQSKLSSRVVFCKDRLGISNARNIGTQKSSGQIIAFTDDDAALFPDWCEKLLAAFDKFPEVMGVTGKVIPGWPDPESKWFPLSLYWMIGCTAWKGNQQQGLTNSVAGVNMAFRRTVFERIRFADYFADGEQEQGKRGLTNDDNEFVSRVLRAHGNCIMYIPELGVVHKVYPYKVSMRYVRRYSYWQGVAEAMFYGFGLGYSSGRPRRAEIFGIARDLLTPARSKKAQRIEALLNAVIFGILGVLSYRNIRIRKFIANRI